MASTAVTPADAIRAKQAAAIREGAQHDAPRLDRAAALLDEIAPLVEELNGIGAELLTDYISIHLRTIFMGTAHAKQAIVNATKQVADVLAQG